MRRAILSRRAAGVAAFGALALAVTAPTAAAAVTPHPAIVSVGTGGVTQGRPGKIGTRVVLTVRVRAAISCTFRAQHRPFSSFYLVRTVACASGHARVAMPALENPNSKTEKLVYRITVRGRGGVTQRQVTVAVAGKAKPIPSSTPSASTPTPAPMPTPTPAPPPATVPATAVPAGSPTALLGSPNWSGYYLGGGPYNAVTGTFNVPMLAPATTETDFAAWVGIDGADNSSLIQAGVAEQYDPATNTVYGHAWWEILPQPETPIALDVQPGDEITVTIGQVSGTLWEITITDDSSGQTFNTEQTYAGIGDSAEWIVEAPAFLAPGSTDPTTATISTLGDYTPNITFSHLLVNGTETTLNAIAMIQNGSVVSAPSPLTANGFTVAYGSTAPPGP
jgi:hypothetical protein